MKSLKKVTVWILISLIVQSSVLFYLDKFYFVTQTNFASKKIETPLVQPEKKDVEIKVPEDAKDINVSYDGKYLAYNENSNLVIVNTITGDKNTIEIDENCEVSFYKWLPDINSMIIAEKKVSAKKVTIELARYEASKDKKYNLDNDNNGKEIFITLPDKKYDVEDIAISKQTNMIYVKVGNNSKKNTIYSFDVMNQMEKMKINSLYTGDILAFAHESRMAYEDAAYNKVYATGINRPITIKGITNPCLIATDDDDNLYLGKEVQGKITEIYYGPVKNSTDKWDNLKLDTPVDKKDIYVSPEGSLYINDNLKGKVTNISNKETKYTGNFVQMYKDGVISIDNGKLSKVTFNK